MTTTFDQEFLEFFSRAPSIEMHDPLAVFLGASDSGRISYRYPDVVRVAGHSCPVTAGAFLMTRKGLQALYGSETPERGGIDVFMRDTFDGDAANVYSSVSGVVGVHALVIQLITGAAAEHGFPGIGPLSRFIRKNLLSYGNGDVSGLFALRRRDTGQGVQITLDLDVVPADEDMISLKPRAIAGEASEAELKHFAQLWQQRVRSMLLDHADDEQMIQIDDWQRSAQSPSVDE